jgi:hypothetical protein
MFISRAARLWIARHPSISELDPVALALESLASTTLENRLPTAQEMAEMDGLVVVASSPSAAGFSKRDIESVLNGTRNAGRTLQVLAIGPGDAGADHRPDAISWRASVSLSELADFVETLGHVSPEPSPATAPASSQ